MPVHGCEHLNNNVLEKVRAMQKSDQIDRHFIQYRCVECSISTNLKALAQHLTESKHGFAVTSKDVYCGHCGDLVYDPSFFISNLRKRKSPQPTEEDEAYIAANTLPKPCGREGVRGLFNLGETCYMNSVLQMMVHNSLLGQYFLGMGHPVHKCPIAKEPEKKNDDDDSDDELNEDKEQKTCVACAMTELFSETAALDIAVPTHAVNLLFASWKQIPHMSGKGQQDAQEWFTIIIDKLHETATNPDQKPNFRYKDRCDCFFHRVFYGRFASEVTCDVCHKSTITQSEYSSLDLDFQKQKKRKKKQLKEAAAANAASTGKVEDTGKASSKKAQAAAAAAAAQLPPPIPSLAECLKAYTAPEALVQESQQIDCQTCKQKTTAQKRLRINKLPAILTMHVKRFGMKKPPGSAANGANGSNGVLSSYLGTPEKYEGKLDFPLVLDMTPYTIAADSQDMQTETQPQNPSNLVYDLDCVLVHT
ncbi:hypothetical protein H2198_005000, partial [Neophaeococcomyces mojaviensis]